MPDIRLSTRVSEDTFMRLRLQSARTRETIQELVDAAIRSYLDEREKETAANA